MSSGRDAVGDDERLLEAERHVQRRLGGLEVDFESLDAVSNIYRAAAAVRRRAEGTVLASDGLSFGAFTILWVLWVWGAMETAKLAQECNLAKGTLTGMLDTLERQGMVDRSRLESDKRRVEVSLTGKGMATIAEVFPKFNAFEAEMTAALTTDEKRVLARLLRRVTTVALDQPDP